MMALRVAYPSHLVDINGIAELSRIEERDGSLIVGALVPHADFHKPVTDGPVGKLLARVARSSAGGRHGDRAIGGCADRRRLSSPAGANSRSAGVATSTGRRSGWQSMSVATTRVDVTLQVNGSDYRIAVDPRKTLGDTLREDCALTGTHLGCEHGVCGACTVLVDGDTLRSCLMFAVQADGRSIRTVESLADGDELHALQRAFVEHHALQCGFCTPGFLMLLAGALERDPEFAEAELTDLLASNLCRCTGYQNIIAAARQALDEMRKQRGDDS